MIRAATPVAAAALALMVALAPALAVMPGEAMDDPALDARARGLYQELRCVVCQNQSIFDSDAEIAADLRALVRGRLLTGDEDQQVRDYVVARYGTYVLLDPPMAPLTYALWFGPPLLLVAGLIAILVWRRRGGTAGPSEEMPLSDEERARLAAIVGERTPADGHGEQRA